LEHACEALSAHAPAVGFDGLEGRLRGRRTLAAAVDASGLDDRQTCARSGGSPDHDRGALTALDRGTADYDRARVITTRITCAGLHRAGSRAIAMTILDPPVRLCRTDGAITTDECAVRPRD
jgi:hypothetical protein